MQTLGWPKEEMAFLYEAEKPKFGEVRPRMGSWELRRFGMSADSLWRFVSQGALDQSHLVHDQ